MTSEQRHQAQAQQNAASNSVSRYGGTTWSAGAGSADLEIEAEDEPPGANRLNPGDTTHTHMRDTITDTAAETTTTDAPVSHANDHAALHEQHSPDTGVDNVTTTTTSAPISATDYVPIEGERVPDELLSGLDPDAAERVGVSVSWVNPKLRACTSTTGSGMFAIEPIQQGEHLIVWTGKIVTAEEALNVMDTEDKHYLLQIGDGFYQTPLSKFREPADYTNHSCEPTAGFGKGSPICLSAMVDIPVGGQVLFDYGMCETDPRLWEPMECMCETPSCRKWITANDWYLYPHLWERYAGYWAPHVQRKIDAYRAELISKTKIENSTPITTVGAEKSAAVSDSTTPSKRRTSSQVLSLPSIDVFDSPAFVPMQVSSTSPSSSGSSSPISTPSSSPPGSPSHTSSVPSLTDLISTVDAHHEGSSRLSQAKAKVKAKLAKQAEKEKAAEKAAAAATVAATSTKQKVKPLKLASDSSSSSSGDESDVTEIRMMTDNHMTPTTTTPIKCLDAININDEKIQQPFYMTWMDRMLATIGLQRITTTTTTATSPSTSTHI